MLLRPFEHAAEPRSASTTDAASLQIACCFNLLRDDVAVYLKGESLVSHSRLCCVNITVSSSEAKPRTEITDSNRVQASALHAIMHNATIFDLAWTEVDAACALKQSAMTCDTCLQMSLMQSLQ